MHTRARAWVPATFFALMVTMAIAPLAAAGPIGLDTRPVPVLDVQVVDASFATAEGTYDVTEFRSLTDDEIDDGVDGTREGTATWRLVRQTGNCCEAYLASMPDGRILDFGGSYINYSDDEGVSWKSVRPLTPLNNGEGAIAGAPNGDIVGVEWDPYTGDHLLSFKYDAAQDKWLYLEMPLHTPFYDREWISTVPGPFTIDGETVPYVTFVKGGYPSKEVFLMSTDALHYTQVSSKMLDRQLNGSVPVSSLATVADPQADWWQPNTNGGMTPLGGGAMVADRTYLFGSDLEWRGATFSGASLPPDVVQADSNGWLHSADAGGNTLTYRVSTDGGQNWQEQVVQLPASHSIEELDFRANGALKLGVVAIHAHNSAANTDQDLLYKFTFDDSGKPSLWREYFVGMGDVNASAGVGQSIRFDFESVALLPDGRAVLTFLDSETIGFSPLTGGQGIYPSIAIEQTVDLPPLEEP